MTGHYGHADVLTVHPDWTKRWPPPRRRTHAPPAESPYDKAMRELTADYAAYWQQWLREQRVLANSPPEEAP